MRTLLLLFCAPAVIAIQSCKKSPATVASSITATNGAINWKFNDNNAYITAGNGFTIRGRPANGSQTTFELSLSANTPIVPGTYTENAAGNPSIQTTFNWYMDLFGIIVGTTTYKTYNSPIMPFTVTVTEINSTSVSGTFSGLLKDVASGATLTMTNGQFYVRK